MRFVLSGKQQAIISLHPEMLRASEPPRPEVSVSVSEGNKQLEAVAHKCTQAESNIRHQSRLFRARDNPFTFAHVTILEGATAIQRQGGSIVRMWCLISNVLQSVSHKSHIALCYTECPLKTTLLYVIPHAPMYSFHFQLQWPLHEKIGNCRTWSQRSV